MEGCLNTPCLCALTVKGKGSRCFREESFCLKTLFFWHATNQRVWGRVVTLPHTAPYHLLEVHDARFQGIPKILYQVPSKVKTSLSHVSSFKTSLLSLRQSLILVQTRVREVLKERFRSLEECLWEDEVKFWRSVFEMVKSDFWRNLIDASLFEF